MSEEPPKVKTTKKRKQEAADANNTKLSKLAKKDLLAIDIKIQYGSALVQTMLQEWRNYCLNGNTAELEIRVGELMEGKFHSSVFTQYFEQMLTLVRAQIASPGSQGSSAEYDLSKKIDVWSESIIFYYTENVRAIQNFKTNTPGAERTRTKEGKIRYEKSAPLNKIDFQQSTECGLHDLRFGLKSETPMTNEQIDEFFSHQPKLLSVRFKSRQTYNFPAVGFKIDFTDVYLAKTEDQVMKLVALSANSSKEGKSVVSAAQEVDGQNEHTKQIEMEVTDMNANAGVIFQHAIQLLGQGSSGVLYLSPVIEKQ
jgi:hypothetical protein